MIAQALDCEVTIEINDVTPAVVNASAVTERVQAVAARMFPDAILLKQYQTMGSEDMAFMMDEIPGCYFFVGSADSNRGLDAPHHHPKFDFDETALTHAAALMAAAAVDLLVDAGN
jgi:amidohydrolase